MNKASLFISLLLLPALAFAQKADLKFQKKIADKVWKIHPDLFNPQREIPDSLREKFSAVVIGQLDFVDAGYDVYQDMKGTETKSNRFYFTRRMVKILDQKGVEDFSKHEFGEKGSLRTRFRRSIAEIKRTFGARLHKPDGSVQDVDMANAFAVTEGKGNDVVGYKIDIPGLQPGDVLEYFTYTEDFVREYDLPAMRLVIADKYPTLESVIDATFDPKLTVEFRGFNGAPDLECSVTEKGRNNASLKLGYVGALTDRHYVNKTREIPFYDFYILNNTSPYRYYPKFMRGGGLYPNPLAGTIFRDISLTLAAANYDSSSFPGKVRKMIKNYRNAHPDATPEQLIDMAWTAANYINMTDKDTDVSDYWLALMMCDVLKKEKLHDNAGVAFINPTTDVPTAEIVNWRQPDFGMLVDDRLFLTTDQNAFLPSETPPAFQGQLSAAYPGDRGKLWNFTMPTLKTLPLSKASENKFAVSTTLTLGDDNNATATNDVTLTGAMKYAAGALTDVREWIAAQEDFLGIEAGKRYKPKNYDESKRTEQLSDAVKEIYKDIFTGENCEISDVAVTSRGITPDAPELKFSFTSKIPEAYTSTPDEIIVKIGNLVGKQDKMDADERERSANISLLAASQDNVNVVVNIPDGYEADEESIAALSKNVKTPLGMFIASAKKSADGRQVTVATRFRINTPLLPPDAWPDILTLTDARAEFNDALLILLRK